MKVIIHPNLHYRSQPIVTETLGAWFPSINIDHWIAWMITQPNDPATRFFPLPEGGGLIAFSRHPLKTTPDQTLVPLYRKLPTSSDRAELWLASESHIEPIIPDHWLAKSLPTGEAVASVWLPRIGLVVFEASDQIDLSNLVTPPTNPTTSSGWKSPPELPLPPTRLAGLALRTPMTSEEVLGNQAIADEGPSIGDQTRDLSDLAAVSYTHLTLPTTPYV